VSVNSVDQIPTLGFNFSETKDVGVGVGPNVSDPGKVRPNTFFGIPDFFRDIFPVLRFRRSDEDLADRRKLDSKEEKLLESREEQVRGQLTLQWSVL